MVLGGQGKRRPMWVTLFIALFATQIAEEFRPMPAPNQAPAAS